MNESPAVVVVAGLSGAGRTTALSALEDVGFYCVDNLPPSAFAPTLHACAQDELVRVALGIDVRVRAFLDPTTKAIEQLRADPNRAFTLLYLDASDATLLARYSATRRPHPLRVTGEAGAESLAVMDGIKVERERLAPLRANASLVIDTSDLNVHELRRKVISLFREQSPNEGMLTRFVSFGFKYSTPADVDVMFDVRFVENPYFNSELRPFSGLDAPVSEFVLSVESARRFAAHVRDLLAFLIPEYEREGKSYLTVGFGCTGGRHRSVALAEWIAGQLRAAGTQVTVSHRDIERVHTESLQHRAVGDGQAKS